MVPPRSRGWALGNVQAVDGAAGSPALAGIGHHVIHALRRKPQALCNSVYRDNLFPRTEYAGAWRVLQRDLPRRDACRRMVDLLFIAAKSLVNGPARRNWRICSRPTLPAGHCQILKIGRAHV